VFLRFSRMTFPILLFRSRWLAVVALLATLLPAVARAQYSEAGILLGASNYKGELSHSLFNTHFLHPAIGVFYRHNWNRHWSWKAGASLGKISGDDAKSDVPYEVNRNLSFYSSLWEGYGGLEFNFFPYETGQDGFRFSPYLHTGLALFHFNPKAELNGDEYVLHDLSTEGEGMNGVPEYKRLKLSWMIGGGLKISAGQMGFGLEVSARRAYSDYLDDVSTVYPDLTELAAIKGPAAAALSDRSLLPADPAETVYPGKQRGNPNDNDWYVFYGVTVFVRLNSLIKDSCLPFKSRRY
jgi:hypothetical protein